MDITPKLRLCQIGTPYFRVRCGLKLCIFGVFDDNSTPATPNSRLTNLFKAADETPWIGDEGRLLTQCQNGQCKAAAFHPAWNGVVIYNLAADEAGLVWTVNEASQLARDSDGLIWNPKAGGVAKVLHIINTCIRRCNEGLLVRSHRQAVAKFTRVPGAVGRRARTVSP